MKKYYMYHKPRGEITARTDTNRKTVMDGFSEEYKDLFPVGRLDKETEGLLLFTDDGALCSRLLNPGSHVPKTYLFYSLGVLSEEQISLLQSGVYLDNEKNVLTSPAKLSVLSVKPLSEISYLLTEFERKRYRRHENDPVTVAHLTITEGKKHQVRKMLLSVGGRVLYLKRISIGSLSLGDLPLGELRPLTEEEREALFHDCNL